LNDKIEKQIAIKETWTKHEKKKGWNRKKQIKFISHLKQKKSKE
jgi:hypothetical protein